MLDGKGPKHDQRLLSETALGLDLREAALFWQDALLVLTTTVADLPSKTAVAGLAVTVDCCYSHYCHWYCSRN